MPPQNHTATAETQGELVNLIKLLKQFHAHLFDCKKIDKKLFVKSKVTRLFGKGMRHPRPKKLQSTPLSGQSVEGVNIRPTQRIHPTIS